MSADRQSLPPAAVAFPRPSPFRWQDGERLVVFGADSVGRTSELIDPGYALLTTPRAAAQTSELVSGARAVHEVPDGNIEEVAGSLRALVKAEHLVAVGGGRVIDVAKALAAADPPRRVTAVPTTLSGAEMTRSHRQAAGVPMSTPCVRPAVVVNDPRLSTSLPGPQLAASASNALAHAVEGPLVPEGHPVAALTGLYAARMIAQGFQPDEPDRDMLALGGLLAGYVIDSSGFGLHHVLSQSLARTARVPHARANAIMLPHSLAALARRAPSWNNSLGAALGQQPQTVACRLRDLSGVTRLRDAGVTEAELEDCVAAAADREELQYIPPAPDREELRAIYAAAY